MFKRKKNSLKDLSMVGFYALIIILGLCLSKTFLKPNNICNILINASVFGVLALGQTLIMLVKEIDLSVGSAITKFTHTTVF